MISWEVLISKRVGRGKLSGKGFKMVQGCASGTGHCVSRLKSLFETSCLASQVVLARKGPGRLGINVGASERQTGPSNEVVLKREANFCRGLRLEALDPHLLRWPPGVCCQRGWKSSLIASAAAHSMYALPKACNTSTVTACKTELP